MWFSVASPPFQFLPDNYSLILSASTPPVAFLLPSAPFHVPLFLDLKNEKAQVDVFRGQQLVAFHAVTDGQRGVLCLVGIVREDMVLDDWFDLHIIIWALEQEEGTFQRRVHLALQDELEGKCALAGQVGVALRVVNPCFQHPCLVKHCEAWRLIIQPGDEVICAIWPELHLYARTRKKLIFSFIL